MKRHINKKMTNLLALCLVLTSLAAAGVWTPTPEKQKQGEDVIVKEGHRTVVVEYEQDGQPNTIVSISPEQHRAPYKPEFSTQAEGGIPSSASGMVEKAKEKIKEASSSLPNLGQGVSQSSEESERESHASPKELICDALGKCKHKIASAMGKTKEIVSETAQEAIDKTKEKAHEAEEEAKLTAREVISKPKEKAQELGDAAAHAFGKAKETLSRKAQEVEEYAKESVEDAMVKVKDAKDTGKKIGEHIAMNVSEKVEMAKEEVAEKTKETKETAERAAEKLKKQSKMGMSGILERGRDVGYDAVKYAKSPEAMRSLMFVLNLLGLATAYGMCVWVTFISSYILAAAMPRHQFGIVQSKIYPVYFSAMAASIGATLVGLVLGNTRRPVHSRKAEILQAYFLLSSLLMVLVNMLYLEPRATKVPCSFNAHWALRTNLRL